MSLPYSRSDLQEKGIKICSILLETNLIDIYAIDSKYFKTINFNKVIKEINQQQALQYYTHNQANDRYQDFFGLFRNILDIQQNSWDNNKKEASVIFLIKGDKHSAIYTCILNNIEMPTITLNSVDIKLVSTLATNSKGINLYYHNGYFFQYENERMDKKIKLLTDAQAFKFFSNPLNTSYNLFPEKYFNACLYIEDKGNSKFIKHQSGMLIELKYPTQVNNDVTRSAKFKQVDKPKKSLKI